MIHRLRARFRLQSNQFRTSRKRMIKPTKASQHAEEIGEAQAD